MTNVYRVGLYLNSQDNDPSYEGLDSAKSEARKLSDFNNGTPVAVWNMEDKTIYLYAGNEEFQPTTRN